MIRYIIFINKPTRNIWVTFLSEILGVLAWNFFFLPRMSRLCVFAYEYFVFLGRVTNPSAKPPFLEDQFVSLSLASLLRPVRLGRPYQEHEVPAGIAR